MTKGLKAISIIGILEDPNYFSSMVTSLGRKLNVFFIYYYFDQSYWKNVNFLGTMKRYQPKVLYKEIVALARGKSGFPLMILKQ